MLDPEVQWLSRPFALSALGVTYKCFCGSENLGHQLGRCRLGVDPQQRLGTGHAEQYPSFRSVAAFGRVEEELYPVESFLSHNGIASQASGSVGTRP